MPGRQNAGMQTRGTRRVSSSSARRLEAERVVAAVARVRCNKSRKRVRCKAGNGGGKLQKKSGISACTALQVKVKEEKGSGWSIASHLNASGWRRVRSLQCESCSVQMAVGTIPTIVNKWCREDRGGE
jgi:hypothetical protein